MLTGRELLANLSEVSWGTASNVYGNSHSTLIGLLVNWWISGGSASRWALDPGPSNGFSKRGHCDALFCEGDSAIGVLEIEGGADGDNAKKKYQDKIDNTCRYFDATNANYKTLQFAILLFYRAKCNDYTLVDGDYKPDHKHSWRHKVCEVSRTHLRKSIIVVTLDKCKQEGLRGVRNNNYYRGELNSGIGYLFADGVQTDTTVYFSRSSEAAKDT